MRPEKSAASGEDRSWRQQVVALTKESPRAYLIAVRIVGSPALAEEVVQEAYAKLLQHPLKSANGAQADVYLFKTVRSTAIDLLRSTKNRKQREDEYAVKQNATCPAPDAVSESTEIAQAARAALTQLPLEEREAISLCCEQDLPRSTVSQILDVPESTVYDRVQRGLDKLRLRLAAQGFAAVTPLLIGQGLRDLGIPPAPSGLLRAVGDMAKNTAYKGLRAAGKKVAIGRAANTAGAAKVAMGMVLAGAVATAYVLAPPSPSSKPPVPQKVSAPAPVAPPPAAPAPAPVASSNVAATANVRALDDNENGLLWYQIADSVPTTFGLSTEQAHGGKQSLRIVYREKPGDSDPYTQLLHPFALRSGDRALRFAMYAASSEVTANWNIQVRLSDRTCWMLDHGYFKDLKAGWNVIDIDLQKAPQSQTFGDPVPYRPLTAEALIFSICNGAATVYLDDFELIGGK